MKGQNCLMSEFDYLKPRRPRSLPFLCLFLAVVIAASAFAGVLAVKGGAVDMITGVVYSSKQSQPVFAGIELFPGYTQVASMKPVDDAVFSRPDQMRGVWLSDGVDYLLNESDDETAVKAQLDAAFAKLGEWKFNTVIVPFSDTALAGASGFDAIAYILSSARERGIYVYGVLDMKIRQADEIDPCAAGDTDLLCARINNLIKLYSCDGYLLHGFGYDGEMLGGVGYSTYMTTNPGSDFEAFMQLNMTRAMERTVLEIRKHNSNLYIGMLADPVWASSSVREDGVESSGIYSSLSDGRADTKKWVRDGLFDFVMIDNHLSTDNAPSFDTVLNWWAALCGEQKIPMIVRHASDKAGENEAGWTSPDQLTKQVMACQGKPEWGGSLFHSVKSLTGNPGNSTSVLLAAFNNDVNPHIGDRLNITSPSKTSFTTYESQFNIRGNADPNFPLIMNGNEIEVSEHGYFSLDASVLNLKIGTNTFTFEHKGETVTYTISRIVKVLLEIAPKTKQEVDGGSKILITAIAYRGAAVTAKINGKTISMKPFEAPAGEDGATIIDSDYDYYIGEYIVPEGIIGKAQNLGSVVVSGSYGGNNPSETGGQIVVRALPEPPVEDTPPLNVPINLPPVDPADTDGSVLGAGKLVVVTTDYAETFDEKSYIDESKPMNAFLPRGTTDVVISQVSDPLTKKMYYRLGCGRLIYQKDVTEYKEHGTIKENHAEITEIKSLNNGDTQITIKNDWRIPYNFQLFPQSYGTLHNISSFTATYADFTFAYTTSAKGDTTLPGNSGFNGLQWIDGANNTKVLRLNLRSTGVFSGYSTYWDAEQCQLVIVLRKVTGLAAGAKPLAGKRIVIDPGHGGSSSSANIGDFMEKHYALIYSNRLRQKLEALGATVIMTRTTDVLVDNQRNPPSLLARNAYARNNFSDMFISMHVNAATNSSSARGSSVFYYNEYSMLLARYVGESCKQAYSIMQPNGYNRSTSYLFERFLVMQIHDCPTILIESGFVTNTGNLELMKTETFNEQFNQAIVDGILEYFRNRPQ